ncbi:DUF3883 domain-containing protein [Atlantibacter subterranea]|uniref:DUF3883 domain-containing protein n=1 Tax=Atlantibacter subterraneus TaxID=255519 RepID=A0A3R9FQX4_9ENTR|nr:DUF3883 domain-containing protein [Atlantibacter subterranea]MDA3132213.1 DUF3883 domain-containing protein [Atlantibacter subterranea]RSB60481.1 DUF3883 domain-containing protein [Atlantibacter subterranea]RSE02572.1 DUF3883 domain-containing protein [Atlantibacter subterranea]RSE23176.1 DUF3883 domain-containing protein [Atlantibacter subterranea]
MTQPISWPPLVTTAELAALTAGGIDYIRTKNNIIKGLALKLTVNPLGPEVIVFGGGKNMVARAERFLASQAVVPAYVKLTTNRWKFYGLYRATAIKRDKHTITKYRADRLEQNIDGVLFLENVAEPTTDSFDGQYGDAKTRKAVEEAAIKAVWKYLEDNGYTVKDRQSDNCGYDLYAQKGKNFILAEVKGTDSSQPRFLLSRNERAHSETDAGWRLFVVCKARTSPEIMQYTADEMEAAFSFSPKSWECHPKIR